MIYLLILASCLYLVVQYLIEKKLPSTQKTSWGYTIFFTVFLLVSGTYFLIQYDMLPNFDLFFSLPRLSHAVKGSLILAPITIIFLVINAYLSQNQAQETTDSEADLKPQKGKIIDRIAIFLATIFCTLSYLFYFSCKWVMARFGNIKIDQIIYTITQPLEGTDESQIVSYVFGPLVSALFFGLLTIMTYLLALNLLAKITKNVNFQVHPAIRGIAVIVAALGIFAAGVFGGVSKIGYADVKAYFIDKSTIYEDDYVDPKSVDLTFPEKKRNLIYIFAESLETSYMSKDKGGSQNENLLPKLTEMLDQGAINFSNTEQYGGALATPATGFTVGGLVAQTAGVPVKASFEEKTVRKQGDAANEFGKSVEQFLPGAYSLGEILKSEGYNQTFMLGSKMAFAGRDKYFSQHGDYDIVDYDTAKERNWIPQDYRVWWGYEDEKLLTRAKEVVTDLSNESQPFNFTLLTADTHFEDGLMTDKTPKLFDDKYSNVIHYSDQLISQFIDWAKQQPFYENTTIVVVGDHLTMDKNFFDNTPDTYERTVFNLFDNPAVKGSNLKNRLFNTMDLFPTTLASLGVTIDGNRLGLGTNLFSNKATLMEELGADTFNLEVSKRSSYYDNKIKVEKVSNTTSK